LLTRGRHSALDLTRGVPPPDFPCPRALPASIASRSRFYFRMFVTALNLLCEDLMFVTAYKDDTSSIDSVVKWIICVQIDFFAILQTTNIGSKKKHHFKEQILL
jgi:hypothetical protein